MYIPEYVCLCACVFCVLYIVIDHISIVIIFSGVSLTVCEYVCPYMFSRVMCALCVCVCGC